QLKLQSHREEDSRGRALRPLKFPPRYKYAGLPFSRVLLGVTGSQPETGNRFQEALPHFRLEAEPRELYSQVEPGNKEQGTRNKKHKKTRKLQLAIYYV
ncbi:MAG: hypothetical protein SWZ49_11355, partial [Cyanobacteriota bacterium]|nr:hypothetical protein [Cyanobacteriota bacterium]